MPLGAPSIDGPVSTCSRFVKVQGQFSGSRVRLFVDGDPVPVGDMTVGWADAQLPVDTPRLVAGRTLRAEQIVGPETSDRSPQGKTIDLAVNGVVTVPYQLYACAQSLLVADCCPGARLEVWQSGALLGSADAVGSQAWIAFNAGNRLQAGAPVEIRQFICTSATPFKTRPGIPIQPPADAQRRLASPRFVEPLEECQRLVPLEGIIPGAVVRLLRGAAPIWDSSVPYSAVSVLVEALHVGEDFLVSQSMPRCEHQPQPPNVARVHPLRELKPPRIDGPLCAGPHQITISRLKPGATLRLFANGIEIGRWEAGALSMPVDITVPTPATLTARQELCSIVSPDSRPYTATSGRSGRWTLAEDGNGADLKAHSFAIHAALARTGKIVMFSGDQHNSAQNLAQPQDIDHCELFDCASRTLTKIDAPTTDVFCSGHAFMPDGRLLVIGGTDEFPLGPGHFHTEHFPGLADSWIFDPDANADGKHWTKTHSMRGGRWYPTPLTLPNGRVLAISGHPNESDASRHNNNSMETYRPGAWTFLGDSPDIESRAPRYVYPRVVVGPTGGAFSATPIVGDSPQDPGRSALWPGSGLAWARSAGPLPGGWGAYDGFTAPAVLLPLFEDAGDPSRSFRARVLLAGEPTPWMLDLGTPAAPNPNPSWQALGSQSRRLNSNLVLLPSGEVLLCGGVGDSGDDQTAVKEPEMLVPNGASWTWDAATFASATIPRNYHSTALLMPGGQVFTGGSNINASPGDESVRRLELELYEPWYMCAERPKILVAPVSVRAGARLIITVRSKEPITRIALLRAGSATHGFNHDQRYVGLVAKRLEDEQFVCTVPSRNVAVPGYYLVHAVTERKVPSEGVFVRVI